MHICLATLIKVLVVVEGKLVKGVTFEQAEQGINEEINRLTQTPVSERELNKVRQKAEAGLVFGEMNHDNRALNLAYFEMLGDASQINSQVLHTWQYQPSN
jgi:predicted Zn-dependent peptidase